MGRLHREARAHAKFQKNLAIVAEQEKERQFRLFERQRIIDERQQAKDTAEREAKEWLIERRAERTAKRAEKANRTSGQRATSAMSRVRGIRKRS
jgi:hypothetical protein